MNRNRKFNKKLKIYLCTKQKNYKIWLYPYVRYTAKRLLVFLISNIPGIPGGTRRFWNASSFPGLECEYFWEVCGEGIPAKSSASTHLWPTSGCAWASFELRVCQVWRLAPEKGWLLWSEWLVWDWGYLLQRGGDCRQTSTPSHSHRSWGEQRRKSCA